MRPVALVLLRGAVLAAVAVVMSAPATARAQACCAGASVLYPGRMKVFENELLGIATTSTAILGSFDPAATYRPNPPATGELQLEQQILGTVRVLERGQVGISVPFVETRNQVPTLTDLGGGLGDVQLAARYDFLYAGNMHHLPGIALLAAITAPTGTPPESARDPLGSGATGIGAWQGGLGLSLEHVQGSFLVSATGTVSQRSARSVEGIHEQLGPELQGFVAVGWAFYGDAAMALTASVLRDGSATLDGVQAPGSSRALTTVGLACGGPISSAWRIQGSLFDELPVNGLGRNEPVGVGVTLGVMRTFL